MRFQLQNTIFSPFQHYYDEEGDDCSLLDNLMIEKNFDDQKPMIRISNKSKDKDNYIQYLNELYSFHITAYQAICMEIELENWAKDNDEIWTELQTHEMFERLFKDEKDKLVNLYLKLKNKSDDAPIGESKVYVERIKVKELDEEDDSDIDDVFEEFYGIKIKPPTKEEKEADCYRDALILDNGNEQFISVFHVLNDDEMYQSQTLSLYYCTPDDERFTTLSLLVSDFQHRDNYPIYEIKFDHYKDKNKTFYSAGSLLSDVRYFPYLSGFLTELNNATVSN